MGFLKFDTTILQFKFGSIEEKFYIYLIRKENKERFNQGHKLGEIYLTRGTIAKDLETSEGIARRLLKQFQELEIIKLIKSSPKTSKKPSLYMLTIYETLEPKINQDDNQDDNQEKTKKNGLKSTVIEFKEPRNHQDDNQDDNQSIIDNIINNKNNNIYSRVIDHLNEKTSKSFKYTTKKTKSCIDARIREGFKEADFLKVIDIKTEEWKDNPHMSKDLRPETLFGTKFESYLQQGVKQNQEQQQIKSLYGANKL